MNSRPDWLHAPRSVALLVAAFVTTLVLGFSFLTIDDPAADASKLGGDPLTDAQAAAQVVDSARQFVTVARLQELTGGYTFVSCRNEGDPPYQVAAYMSFLLPQTNSIKYLREVADSMVAHGWTDAPSMAEHFGQKLTRNGVTAIFHRNVNDADFATMRIYGECRNTADHRNDNPAWTEVTDLLG